MDHKGYLQYSPEGGFRFDIRRNLQSTKIEKSITLPDFIQRWTHLFGEDILIPGHGTVSSFLKSSTSNNAPSANFVSAKETSCPPAPPRFLKPFILRIHTAKSGSTLIKKIKMGCKKWKS